MSETCKHGWSLDYTCRLCLVDFRAALENIEGSDPDQVDAVALRIIARAALHAPASPAATAQGEVKCNYDPDCTDPACPDRAPVGKWVRTPVYLGGNHESDPVDVVLVPPADADEAIRLLREAPTAFAATQQRLDWLDRRDAFLARVKP